MSESANVIVALAGAIRDHAAVVERSCEAVAALDTAADRVTDLIARLSSGDYGAYGATGPGIRVSGQAVYVWVPKRNGSVSLEDLLANGPDSPETILGTILDAIRLDIVKVREHATSTESRRDTVRSLADRLASALDSLSPSTK